MKFFDLSFLDAEGSRADRRIAAMRFQVCAFYIFCFSNAVLASRLWLAMASSQYDPLWPVFWARWVGVESAVAAVMALFLAGTGLAAAFPRNRAARVLAFAGLLEFVALINSKPKIDHPHHALILVSFMFAFLPPRAEDAEDKKILSAFFWAAQAILLLTYTMSGLAKFTTIFENWGARSLAEHFFIPTHNLNFFNRQAPLMDAALDRHIPTVILYWATAVMQSLSIFAAFRPRLHRPWAAFLILFHVANVLVLDVHFINNIVLLALFLFHSPFVDAGDSEEARAA